MTAIKTRLVHKVGPLPVWAWAALAVAAWFLFLRGPHTAAGGTQLPYTPQAAAGSGAQQPSSGQGTAADNGSSDLLDALGQNSSAQEALLAALQASGLGGGYGATGAAGGGSAGGASATSAATVDSGVNNAPVDSFAPIGTGTITQNNTASSGLPVGTPVVDPGFYTYEPTPDTSDALSRYLLNTSGVNVASTPTAVTAPTPTVVQPAPVATGGVLMPPPIVKQASPQVAF